MGVERHQPAGSPAAELRALKSHLLRGPPTILGNQDSTAHASDGGLPHQQTTKSGTELSIKVLERDNSECPQRLLAEGMYLYRVRPMIIICSRRLRDIIL